MSADPSPARSEIDAVDAATGTPRRFRGDEGDPVVGAIEIVASVELLVGGGERRAPTGGLEYPGATWITATEPADERPDAAPATDHWSAEQAFGDWRAGWTWRQAGPGLPLAGLELLVRPVAPAAPPLRNLRLTVDVHLGGRSGWELHAPGNMVRRGVALDELPDRIEVSPAAGSRGSSALVAVCHRDGQQVVVWPLCLTEVGGIVLTPTDDGIRLTYTTGLAGMPESDDGLRIEPLQLDLARRSWPDTKDVAATWFTNLGITAPAVAPTWAAGATIFEAQVGFSVFRGGHRYEPYPTIADLRADLDRIAGLGFDCIQLMPRQPYPSYNVHALGDIDTTFAPEAELREFVAHCHSLGVRVILDVLMHGVLDRESIRVAADTVRSGPIFPLLDQDPGDVFSAVADVMPYQISWSRHILDFEPYWHDGSPERSPLLDLFPEWFCRDSAGAVTGIYTKAFDAAHEGFQDAFVASVLDLVDRLGIDGFRFDAPTYNGFANWSPSARARASASQLGCVSLFRRLRTALKDRDPELLMYTEPSGIVHRESMDLNYNYDEQWLLGAVAAGGDGPSWSVRSGHDLVRWLGDRDALVPPGSLTAHHVDSHDTFWWPAWGHKWRREQIGVEAVAALTAAFMLCGGPFMLFVGGEDGIERELTALTGLKRRFPALARGRSRHEVLAPTAPSVFSVVRSTDDGDLAVVLVNLSAEEVRAPVAFPAVTPPRPDASWVDAADATGATRLPIGDPEHVVEMPAWSTRVFVVD